MFALLTDDCSLASPSNHIIKYADYTTVLGLIRDNDDLCRREEMKQLVGWSSVNNLILNIDKTKEMIIDFRTKDSSHSPLVTENSAAEAVSSIQPDNSSVQDLT